ncbi:MAG: hypothetical protein AB4368_25665 [Xenococcaceae cyanobacterium]
MVQVKRDRADPWHCVIVNLEDRQPQAIPDLWKEKTPKEKLDAPKDNLLAFLGDRLLIFPSEIFNYFFVG